MSAKQISSSQNTYIKELFLLKEKSRARKKSGSFLIEGVREISLALKGGYEIDTVLFYPELFSEENSKKLVGDSINYIEVSKEVYQKLAYRDTTEGVLAVAKSKEFSLKHLNFKTKNPLILIAEAPEKPGNIGALLR
ncbi:MAG: RNA methyltransferase, partial [Xanthomarina sp.]